VSISKADRSFEKKSSPGLAGLWILRGYFSTGRLLTNVAPFFHIKNILGVLVASEGDTTRYESHCRHK
jgi:hypothetical protein